LIELLQSFCKEIHFAAGDVIRHKGQHYRDMYLLTDGSVDVDRTGAGAAKLVVSGTGAPIGEIGFLHGCPATATVTARTPTRALVLDDPMLARLERENPDLAAELLRKLAETAEERASENLIFASAARAFGKGEPIDVYLCRTPEMLESAQRLRYQVYCEELGRQSPYADHDRKIITDELDVKAYTFIATEAGETIGTLRVNVSAEGPLGVLEELYGMKNSAYHPDATVISTKFIVKKARRGGPASMKLISAAVRYGVRIAVKECYMDSIPALLPYYKAIGFTIAGQKFFHRENGPSFPMVLDIAKHGERLSNEVGLRDYLNLMLKAQAIKMIDSVLGVGKSSRSER
jgi:predicted GNAT family N-acyltransferase